MRLARRVARLGGKGGFLQDFGRDLKEIDHLEDLGIDGRIITMN
jgi:hypothetical protein